MSNPQDESSVKNVESGFANFRTPTSRKKNKKNRGGICSLGISFKFDWIFDLVRTKSETDWIFDLIVKLKQFTEDILELEELPDLFHGKLEKLTEYIRVLEKLPNAFIGLESEFSSVMTLCDKVNGMLQHLHDDATLGEKLSCGEEWTPSGFDFILFVRELSVIEMAADLFRALDKLDDLFSRLVSSETTIGNGDDIENGKADYNQNRVPSLTFQGKRLSNLIKAKENSVIDIQSHEILVEQLDIAMVSQTPVVILFYSKGFGLGKDYVTHFDDLPNDYCHFDGDIKFLRVDVKRAAKELKVEAYPTVMVFMPYSFGLMLAGKLSIQETLIVPAFVKAVYILIDEFLWEHYGFK